MASHIQVYSHIFLHLPVQGKDMLHCAVCPKLNLYRETYRTSIAGMDVFRYGPNLT